MNAGNRADRAILALNIGSSSLKWSLFDGDLARLGGGTAAIGPTSDIAAEATAVLAQAAAVGHGTRLVAIGHRVVHGGERFGLPTVVDSSVIRALGELADLAPLHNPPALAAIQALAAVRPDLPQVACFDTAFHATMPEVARRWALPQEWQDRWRIRRFGFHGLSHAWSSRRAAELLPNGRAERVVTCHLGSGCSLAAVRNGRSIATTMGFTTLDGLMMATRPGAVDPGVLLFLLQEAGLAPEELADGLSRRSGLLGVAGTADMREVVRARSDGDERAELAFDLFVYRLRGEIAAMAAALEGIDALVFTGGIGEHAASVRAAVGDGLGWLGVAVEQSSNERARPDVDIAQAASAVRVLVVACQEERLVADETRRLLFGEAASRRPST